MNCIQLILPAFGNPMRILTRLQRREGRLVHQQLIHLGHVVSQRGELMQRRRQFDPQLGSIQLLAIRDHDVHAKTLAPCERS